MVGIHGNKPKKKGNKWCSLSSQNIKCAPQLCKDSTFMRSLSISNHDGWTTFVSKTRDTD